MNFCKEFEWILVSKILAKLNWLIKLFKGVKVMLRLKKFCFVDYGFQMYSNEIENREMGNLGWKKVISIRVPGW